MLKNKIDDKGGLYTYEILLCSRPANGFMSTRQLDGLLE